MSENPKIVMIRRIKPKKMSDSIGRTKHVTNTLYNTGVLNMHILIPIIIKYGHGEETKTLSYAKMNVPE